MKCFGNIRLQEKFSKCNPCFYYLAAVGFLEALLMAGGTDFYYEHKNYLLFPVFMFFGAAFMQELTPSAKRKLLLGVLAVAWFLVIQKHRSAMGWKLYPFSWFPAVYLMAYPFAAVTQDGESNRGIKIYAGCFLAASLVLTCYGVLLLLDRVPPEYASVINYFNRGTRFSLIWNPNILGCIFTIAIVFCIVSYVYTKKQCMNRLFVCVGIVLFVNLALTNSRVAVIVLCSVSGGMVFLYFYKDGWKKLFVAFLAACVVMLGIFFLSESLYESHRIRLLTRYSLQVEEIQDSDASLLETVNLDWLSIFRETESLFLGLPASIGDSANGDSVSTDLQSQSDKKDKFYDGRNLGEQLGSLAGRTTVWWAALRSIREDPSILLYGCEHVGDTISLYTEQPYMHSHNSWVEITMSLGLPGAIIALIYTWIAVWNSMVLLWHQTVPLWKKGIALLVLGLLAAGFMEPYLFFSNQFYHFIDFMFFLCLGYVRVWVEALPRKFDSSKFPLCLL